jgi:hypothetical protein
MISIVTNIESAFLKLKKFLERKRVEIDTATRLSVLESAKIVKEEVVQSIRDEGAVASGSLIESVTIGSMTASTEMYEITVGSSSPYAKFVEEGVRAGGKQPPPTKIYEWMVNKGIEPSESGAYLIGRSIAKRGIPAKHPFEKGTQKAESRINSEVNIIFDKTLTKN